jgi:hypothetical protein
MVRPPQRLGAIEAASVKTGTTPKSAACCTRSPSQSVDHQPELADLESGSYLIRRQVGNRAKSLIMLNPQHARVD